MMTVGMILRRQFPPDIRVEKEVRSLLEAGHKLHLLCLKDDARPVDENMDGLIVHRRDFYPTNTIARKACTFWSELTFRNYKLIGQIEDFISSNNIESLHVHDLPMVLSAKIAASKCDIPIIADFHENYPEAMPYFLVNAKLHTKLLNSKGKWKRYEARAVHLVDHIIVVVEEAKERIVPSYGVPENRVTVVSNTEDIDSFEALPLDQELIERYSGRFVVTYLGGFGIHRGLEVPIKALPQIQKQIPNILLLLVGDGNNREQLETLAKSLMIDDKVEFTGWKPFHLMRSYIALSHVCIVPHNANPHTNSTVPHKLFQYMLMAKPVIVSDCKPLARIVKATHAGLVFESGSPEDFADKCVQMLDSSTRQKYGDSGRNAVLTEYNWQRSATKLIDAYHNLASHR